MSDDKMALMAVAPEVVGDVVADLETALAQAMAGEIQALAMVQVQRAGNVITGWSGGGFYHSLNSGAARLAASLAREPGEPMP